MKSLKDMKQKGRALRKHLEVAFGKEVSLSQAYEALAAMEGATSWNALSAALVAPTTEPVQMAMSPKVRAVVMSRVGSMVREFDAGPWFLEASAEQIALLMNEKPALAPSGYELSYGGGQAARALAEHRSVSSELSVFFGYCSALNDISEKASFNCYVDFYDVAEVLSFKKNGAPKAAPVLPARPLPEIRAIFRTVDGKASTGFDASPWFAQATDEEIESLLAETVSAGMSDFQRAVGGNDYGDDVALFCAGGHEGLAKVYAYIKAMTDVGQDCGGSNCFLNAADVDDYLGAKRAASYVADGLYSELKVLEVNLVDVLNEYDAPDDVPDWQWVEDNHSFAHKANNAEPGVWEFMVHVEKTKDQSFFEGMPVTLRPFFERAKADGAAWVMFHQG